MSKVSNKNSQVKKRDTKSNDKKNASLNKYFAKPDKEPSEPKGEVQVDYYVYNS
jgi:hypothetical protein